MTLPILTPHEPTEACLPMHCHSHHVDEPDEPSYLICLECGHVYRTAGELRAAYRRIWSQITFGPSPTLQTRLADLWGWLRSRFARARDITFCQECLHDW